MPTASTLALAGFPPPLNDLPVWAQADPAQPDTLGWRAWKWFSTQPDNGFLMSPHQTTPWPTAELAAEKWSDEEAVRGVAGIHARLLPKKKWQLIGWPDGDASAGLDDNPFLVTGIVERFGRYVLGTTGWRAERVVIRELLAPSIEIGLQLEEKYPDVVVHYMDQFEGDKPCISVKSSASASANQNPLLTTHQVNQLLAQGPFPLQTAPPPSQPANPPTQNPQPGQINYGYVTMNYHHLRQGPYAGLERKSSSQFSFLTSVLSNIWFVFWVGWLALFFTWWMRS